MVLAIVILVIAMPVRVMVMQETNIQDVQRAEAALQMTVQVVLE